MPQFTFDTYNPKDGHPPQDGIMWDLADKLRSQKESIIREAGFDPHQIQEAGQLTAAWKTHPKDAIILAPKIDFETGNLFAVSREAVPSNP